MSRTTRRIPADPPRELQENPERMPRRPWEQAACCRRDRGFLTVPDGKRSWLLEVQRDNRCTGLRRHKDHRRQARQLLRSRLEPDRLPAGRRRRYNIAREQYRL